MKTQTHQKYLYKPKRIRKKKKDFLRGRVDNPKPMIASSESTPIPLPYVLLFAVLIATIIGYTSLSFLFGRIHINTAPVYSALINTVTSIKLPHLVVPSVHIPILHIQIHFPSLPFNKTKQLMFFLLQQNLFWILPLIAATLQRNILIFSQQATVAFRNFCYSHTCQLSIRQTIDTMLAFSNPLPYWTTVFTTTLKLITQLITLSVGMLQIYGPSTIATLNPLPIVQTNSNILLTTILTITNILIHTFTWIRNNLVEYIGTLALWTKQLGIFSLKLASNLMAFVINTTITQITFTIHLLFALVSLLVQGTLTVILTVVRLLWEGIVTVWIMCEEIAGIAFQGIQIFISWIGFVIMTLYHGLVFVFDSLLALFIAMITAIANWIQSIIMAMKRSLDNMLASILVVIHLGDPLYTIIGQIIAETFISVGQTLGVMKDMAHGGKL